MKETCQHENPLKRDGTGQKNRFLKALQASYIQVDERSLPDLLKWAGQYADELRYYATQLGDAEGKDWVRFMENDVLYTLTSIYLFDLQGYSTRFAQIKRDLMEALDMSNPPTYHPDLRVRFEAYFTITLELAQVLNDWYLQSTPGSWVNTRVRDAIQPYLGNALQQMNYAYLELMDSVPGYATLNWGTYDPIWGVTISDNPIWGYLSPTIYGGNTLPPDEYSMALVGSNGAEQFFDQFYQALGSLKRAAPTMMEEMLHSFPNHEPHMALYLAFLQLFQVPQREINQMAQRHLDFYYREVLRLQEKPAQPDHVHLIFTPAKGVEERRIEAGKAYKAGKDALGKEVVYTADEEIVVNRAVAQDFKTTFVNKHVETGNADQVVDQLYAAPQAETQGGNTPGSPQPSWKALGGDQSLLAARDMDPARAGFAFASPILALAEGNRQVILTLSFEDPDSLLPGYWSQLYAELKGGAVTDSLDEMLNLFEVDFTGAEAWLPMSTEPIMDGNTVVNPNTVSRLTGGTDWVFTLNLNPDVPAVTAYNPAVHGDDFRTEWPMVRMRLKPDNTGSAYDIFRRLHLRGVRIGVDVRNVANFIGLNDQGEVDITKPFMPFGAQPSVGSSFYLGSAEIFAKKLTSLKLNLEWLDPPANLRQHYKYYPVYIHNNKRFTVKLRLLQDFDWKLIESSDYITSYANAYIGPNFLNAAILSRSVETFATATVDFESVFAEPSLAADQRFTRVFTRHPRGGFYMRQIATGFPIFDGSDATNSHVIELDSGHFSTISQRRDPGLKTLAPYRPGTENGFLKLELNGPDFQHKVYPNLLTRMAMSSAANISKDLTYPTVLPNAPYTPVIKSLMLDYSSEVVLDFSDPASAMNTTESIYQVHPFGVAPIQPVAQANWPEAYTRKPMQLMTNVLVPDFETQGNLQEGALFIGLRDMEPGRPVSLLFQVDDGTGDPDYAAPQLFWHYLVHNDWVPFLQSDILSDSTTGLVNSGIVKLRIPENATQDHTLLPADRVWVRVSCVSNTAALPRLIGVHAQAVRATFQDQENDPMRQQTALPPDTISRMVEKDFLIKEIRQPYASFGGRMKESQDHFYRRVSEQLRHKNRSIQIWDYEHIVLEAFPEVYKVKCLNHTDRFSESAPGKVTLLVLPDTRNVKRTNVLQPRASIGLLTRIYAFLSENANLFAARGLEVANPEFEQVHVELKVAFQPGFDPVFYIKKLNQDLIRYLSPWAYDQGAEISLGGKVFKSSIIDFVDELPYVDYVKDVALYQISRGLRSADQDTIQARNSRTILVSVPQHTLTKIDTPCI